MNKKQIRILAGLSCTMFLIVLLCAGCFGSRNGDHQGAPTEPSQTVIESTAEATEATTEATEETAEPTEETTEETEDPTEETTEPTTGSSGGNTTPGGSGGYNPGGSGNNDSGSGSGTTTEKAPAAGSKDSPYVESVLSIPDSFYSVNVPAEGDVYQLVYGAESSVLTIEDMEAYVVYNGEVFEPNEYGVVQVPFAATKSEETPETEAQAEESGDGETEPEAEPTPQPQLFQLCSKATEARSFLLMFQAPLGSAENPEEVEAVDNVIAIEATLAADDKDGYHFSYYSETGCRLTIQAESVTENVNYDIVVTVGETVTKLSEQEEGVLSVNVPAWGTVLIQVITVPGEDGSYPAADIQLLCHAEDNSGSAENPIVIFGEYPIVTAEIEPDAAVYYSVYGAGGMILTIEDPDAYVMIGDETWTAVDGIVCGEVVSSNPREPVVIAVGNSGEAPKSFTVDFTYKPGNMMNPAQLVLEESNIAQIGSSNMDGYWYTWTAEMDGVLTISMPDGHWMYQINDITNSVYGDLWYSDDENVLRTIEMDVTTGTELRIMVCTYDPANPFEAPVGTVEVYASFASISGTEENPMPLYGDVNTVTAAPGASVYCSHMLSGVTMEVSGAGSFTVNYNGTDYASANGLVTIENMDGSRFAPITVIVTNNGAETGTYTITYMYPVGSRTNPHVLDQLGAITVPVQGDGEGYFFTWTAPAAGEFSITMQGDDWSYVVQNLTAFQYGDIQNSKEDGLVTSVIQVSEGDELQINVNSASGKPLDLALVMDFYDPTFGTVENPAALRNMTNTVTVRAGSEFHADVFLNNVTMTVTAPEEFTMSFKGIDYASENGVVTVYGVDATRWTPIRLILQNPGTDTMTVEIAFANPLGSSMNPQQVTELTKYTASVVGDGEGYFYSWIAETDGVFTATMLGDDWTCMITNLTTGYCGDITTSIGGDDPCQIFEVKAQDEIRINIGTASRENKDVSVEFDAYDPNVGTKENPLGFLNLENTVTVRPGSPMYCYLVQTGMTLKVTGDVTVTLDGVGYPAVNGVVTIENLKATRFTHSELILTNSGDKKTNCQVVFSYPKGNMMNPEQITKMGSYSAVVSDDGMGYFFTWTAPEAGQFTLSVPGNDWIYTVDKQSGDVYRYGGSNYSTANDPSSYTVEVAAGDIISVNIGTASGTPKVVPVQFSFEAAPEVPETLIFEGSYTPKTFSVTPEEIKDMGVLTLDREYQLRASKAGIYHWDTEADPLLVLDFTDDTYVNLAELVKEKELLIPVEAADGTVTYQQCNALLEQYLECAWVIEVSEDVTKTLYPLTKDLEQILKGLGRQYGWFASEKEGYLFQGAAQIGEQTEEETAPLTEESLWMFACSYIEFNMDDTAPVQTVVTEQTGETVPAEDIPA